MKITKYLLDLRTPVSIIIMLVFCICVFSFCNYLLNNQVIIKEIVSLFHVHLTLLLKIIEITNILKITCFIEEIIVIYCVLITCDNLLTKDLEYSTN